MFDVVDKLLWIAQEAFIDPERLGKRLSNGSARLQRSSKWPSRLTTLQVAEKLVSLKGTAFRPYITVV
jgi:hypothetical protein